jgi:hypothetical protein
LGRPYVPVSRIRIFFVDTSSLRHAGFRNPDFQKLLLRSKAKTLRIVVAEIAWEEWRTYMRDTECGKALAIRRQFDELKGSAPLNRILGRLPPPALALWNDEEIDVASKAAMAEHAADHGIEIIPIGPDHDERTWRRYFGVKVEPPFNPTAKDREARRKDIPDSWIFEAAVDLIADGRELSALCRDDNLAAALLRIGVRVFREPREVIAELEREESPVTEEVAQVEPETSAQPGDPLATALSKALDGFRDHERKVFGFIAHFGGPAKEELWGLLSRAGMIPQVAKNAAERLTFAGVIQDTGNHYLAVDRQLAQLAIASVEEDIIRLLNQEPPNGV